MGLAPSSSNKNASLHEKLESLREMMEQLRSKATDIQQEIRNEELQTIKKRKNEVTLWLEQVTKIEEKIKSITEKDVNQDSFSGHEELSGRLERMMDSVKQLLEHGEFPTGIFRDVIIPKGLELVPLELEGSTPSKVEDEVWSCFKRGERRVGIIGMGGVGKTTLAMHINNNILKQKHLFDRVYYVTVSRGTTVFKLQSDIANAFDLRLMYQDEPNRAAELRMALARREKSLLILDDVWENIVMEKVGVSVEGDGCKLLITTRRREVCRKMKCFPVKMEPLSPDESWDLFRKQLGDFESLSDEIKKTARLVAKECDGLPLGIITMAGSMRGETDEHVWKDALCNSAADMEDVFRILRFSYDRLPDDKHRKCFLYCALYPDDNIMNRDELVRQFVAAGLLDNGTNRKEGHSVLNALVNASLLLNVTYRGGWKHVKMHSLVRDMAIEIIGSTDMAKDLKLVSSMANQIESTGGIWSKKKLILKWMFALLNVGLELCQAVISQEAGDGKIRGSHYRKLCVILSSICLSLSLLELVEEAKRDGVKWRRRNRGCYCLRYPGKHGRIFGRFLMWFCLMSATVQFSLNIASLVIKRGVLKFDHLGLLLSVGYCFAAIVGEHANMVANVRCSSHGKNEAEGKLVKGLWEFECPHCPPEKMI